MRGSSYPECSSLDLRVIAGLNRRMSGSGSAKSPIAIAISAMREAAGSTFLVVANLNVLLTIFATTGPVEPSVSSHLPDRDRDVEVF